MSAVTECVVVQAAGGVTSFCKIILVLRALLQHHRLAPVLDLLLDHIHFEEFVLAGALTSLEAPSHSSCMLHAIRTACRPHCGGFCGFPTKVDSCPSMSAMLHTFVVPLSTRQAASMPFAGRSGKDKQQNRWQNVQQVWRVVMYICRQCAYQC